MAANQGRFEGWPIVGWSAVLLLSMTALLLGIYGLEEAGVRVVIRATARTSLPLFLAAFVASSVRVLRRNETTQWWLRNRRYLGVSFAVSHGIHLVAILVLARGWPQSFWERTSGVTLYGGGLGYVFILLMTATSSDAAVRRLGIRRWKGLHTVGAWYLFGVFLLNYGPSGFFSPTYIPASALVLLALGARIAARRRSLRLVHA